MRHKTKYIHTNLFFPFMLMTGHGARIAKSVLFSGCWHSLETLQNSSPATAMIVISESDFR